MTTIFTRIIEGELPAHFVWKDERCVAFLSINPIRSGHVLVVPRQEVDHWLDLDEDSMAHLISVSRSIGEAIQNGFQPTRVGLIIAGLDVPHLHIHVLPIDGIEDLDFENAAKDPDPAELDRAAGIVRRELTEIGFEEVAL
ncbi:MAG: HIT family protein [Actinomycetota bacterium]|nr:HIT family protein [Actinomycetota bacterium]